MVNPEREDCNLREKRLLEIGLDSNKEIPVPNTPDCRNHFLNYDSPVVLDSTDFWDLAAVKRGFMVDRTLFIKSIVAAIEGSPSFAVLRPDGFGKTYALQMVQAFCCVRYCHKGEEVPLAIRRAFFEKTRFAREYPEDYENTFAKNHAIFFDVAVRTCF